MNDLKIKAILSPILGIVSIGLFCLSKNLGLDYLIVMLVAMVCSILGLMWGIQGLRVMRQNLFIIGIVICSFGLLGSIYMLIGWIVMAGWLYL